MQDRAELRNQEDLHNLNENPRTDGYKIIAVEDCGCPSEAFNGLYSVVDGETRCTLCGKKIKVLEIFVLNGCPKCTPPRLEELDKMEKEAYNL